jgi:hypothetical protein
MSEFIVEERKSRLVKAAKGIATTALVGIGGIGGGVGAGVVGWKAADSLITTLLGPQTDQTEVFDTLSKITAASTTGTIIFAGAVGLAFHWRLNENGLTENEQSRLDAGNALPSEEAVTL